MGLKRRMHVKPEFSLAAMIDVIFLLLMFFMLTSNFVTTNSLQLQLPSSSSSAPVASTSLNISIKKPDALGQPSKYYLGTGQIDRKTLEARLQKQIVGEKRDPKDLTVTIAAEQGVPIEEVVYVLDIANRLKVKTILATSQIQEDQ